MNSASLLVRLAAKDVAMFRFLLEAHENLAIFSVIEKRPALVKLLFCPDSRAELDKVLNAIAITVPLEILPWPFSED